MRKLFKKALACCLVAALALTCFVGALSVNAETAAALTGKIEVGTVEVADDATTATVPVVITSDNALNAAKITVAAEGWTVKSILDEEGNETSVVIADTNATAKIDAENINGDTFIVEAINNNDGFTIATINVTFTADEAATAATVTATLDPVHAATWNEDVVNLAVTDGAITVAEPEPEGPVLDESLATAVYDLGTNISNKFGIQFNLYLDPAQYGADSFEFRVTKNEFDTSNFTYKAEPVTDVYTAEDTTDPVNAQYKMYSFVKSFALYELQVPTTYSVYLIKDGKEIAYYDYAPVTLTKIAVDRYNESSADANVKKMIVALLNVATKAQTLFASKDIAAADSPLKTFEAPNKDVDTETYAVPYDTLEGIEASYTGAIYKTSIALEDAPVLHYEWYDGSLMDAADSFYVEASYFSKLEKDTVTYTIDGTDTTDQSYGIYSYDFDKTCLYDTDKTVTFTVKKKADDSVIGTSIYSVDTLLLQNISVEGIRGETFQAIASFAAQCRVFFPDL